jgi:hypothetical protein
MLGRHARPCESFLVCIEDSVLLFRACFWCLCSWCDSADLSGFLPDFFEGNMDGCLVHLCD